MKDLQVAGFLDNSSVNGAGLRSVLFLSGCHHHCPGCHNQAMQDPSYGESVPIDKIVTRIKDNIPIIKGVTISGGEPFLQWQGLQSLLKEIRSLNLTSWVYTGYTYNELLANPHYQTLLPWIDVLVEGLFIKDNPVSDSLYIGSANQRILELHNGIIQQELTFK